MHKLNSFVSRQQNVHTYFRKCSQLNAILSFIRFFVGFRTHWFIGYRLLYVELLKLWMLYLHTIHHLFYYSFILEFIWQTTKGAEGKQNSIEQNYHHIILLCVVWNSWLFARITGFLHVNRTNKWNIFRRNETLIQFWYPKGFQVFRMNPLWFSLNATSKFQIIIQYNEIK